MSDGRIIYCSRNKLTIVLQIMQWMIKLYNRLLILLVIYTQGYWLDFKFHICKNVKL